MLHMVVSTHNPESCGFRSEQDDAVLTEAVERFRELAPQREITLRGWWINRGVHEFFMLLDAPNAHAIEDWLVESGLVGRTSCRIRKFWWFFRRTRTPGRPGR
jgi:hypothetical protein